MSAALRIMAIGLRGIPDVEGGVETHAAELYPRLAKLGADVTVVGREPFRSSQVGPAWQGIQLRWLWAPRRRGFEAAVHTALAVLYAGLRRPDILHIHAIGPSITVPLAKMLGLRVVVTHHGEDYRREKWNRFERSIIRLGERFAVALADGLITVSSSVRAGIRARYGRESTWIPNGVAPAQSVAEPSLLARYGLEAGKYAIQVSRLVPEKRQLDLIAAFRRAGLPDWKLVLVGAAQGASRYAAAVLKAAAGDDAIIFTGALSPRETRQLLSSAGVFVLPSSHEGLPIALLEAVAERVPSLASDIPGSREVGLEPECYFTLGETEVLAQRLHELAMNPAKRAAAVLRYAEISRRFDWEAIAQATFNVMNETVQHHRRARSGEREAAFPGAP
jgi:glycosyltransferase involved in cell wall biosynthesis